MLAGLPTKCIQLSLFFVAPREPIIENLGGSEDVGRRNDFGRGCVLDYDTYIKLVSRGTAICLRNAWFSKYFEFLLGFRPH